MVLLEKKKSCNAEEHVLVQEVVKEWHEFLLIGLFFGCKWKNSEILINKNWEKQ